MTDSPRFQLPIDPDERPIESELTQIRTKLELLKQDKTNYVKSEDVIKLYEEVIEQVHALNTIRQAKNKPDEQNRGKVHPNSTGHAPRLILAIRLNHLCVTNKSNRPKKISLSMPGECSRRSGKDYEVRMTNIIQLTPYWTTASR